MSDKHISDSPRFQQLQTLFASHIRDPQNQAYAPKKWPGLGESALEIEPRRLAAYEQLFFNNINSFFSQLFPVLRSILGEARWLELMRAYLQRHQAQTPLFHELGQEFLLFLQNEYQPQPSDPAFLMELAHYEWIELALLVDEQEVGYFEPHEKANLQTAYRLSPLAIPLAYQWPVNQISTEYLPYERPQHLTLLLAYRDVHDQVQFMALTPLLYELLVRLEAVDSRPMAAVISDMAEEMQKPEDELAQLALPAIDGLLQQQVLITSDFV